MHAASLMVRNCVAYFPPVVASGVVTNMTALAHQLPITNAQLPITNAQLPTLTNDQINCNLWSDSNG